jgi:prepilin peptidase CpaA
MGHLFATGFVFLVSYAMISDARHLTIPNWVSGSLIVLFFLHIPFSKYSTPVLHHLLVALSVFAVGLFLFALRWFAGGDVKLMTAVALWAGPSQILSLVALTALFGAMLAVGVLAATKLSDKGFFQPISRRLGWLVPHWARRGLCPYGLAIGSASLLTIPAGLFPIVYP